MSVLDDIAAALRARTKTRMYGTPFADQKLQELEQGATARDTANQQAAFNLKEDQDMAPIRRQVQESLVQSRGATADLTNTRRDVLEAGNSPEMQELKRRKAELELDVMTNKDRRAAERHGPELAKIDAQIARLNRPPEAPRPSFSTVNTTDADGNPIQMRVNNRDPSGTLLGFNKGDGNTGPLAPKASTQEQTNHQYFSSSLKALDELDRSIDAFDQAKGPQAKAEALRSYQAQLALIGNILGKASGDQRVGDKERPVYAQIAGETSAWINLYDPKIAKRRTQEARKFLTSIAPSRNPHGVGARSDVVKFGRDPRTGKLGPQ